TQLHVDQAGNLRVEPTGQQPPPIPRTRGLTGPIPVRMVPPTTEIPRYLAEDQQYTPAPIGEQFTQPVRLNKMPAALRDRRTWIIAGAAAMTLLVVIIAVAAGGGSK